MKEFTYTITDPEGIHARPAGELVKAAKAFESAIKLNKEGKSADCKRVFGIMGLAVKQGQTVTVTVEGSDEEAAAQTWSQKGGFYESLSRKKCIWRYGDRKNSRISKE